MGALKLTPGRIGWLAILGLLVVVAPRLTRDVDRSRASGPLPRFGGVAMVERDPESTGTGSFLDPDADLFEADAIPRIRIVASRADMRILDSYRFQWGGNTDHRRDARVTVYEGNRVYRDGAAHLKGSAGSFRSLDDKPAFTLNFDKFNPGQRFHGLKKIHLNNSVQDPSYLAEQISRELCLAAGVPTTRATQATVHLNDRPLGIYVLVEGWNKQFLKNHFSDHDGALYDGGFAREITRTLDVMCGEDSADPSALGELAEAAREPDPGRRLERLEAILELDHFLSFVAIEVMLAHGDGYAMNRNNYRIYHNPESDRFVFMPHGMDQMFGVFQSNPNTSITPSLKGLVARAVLQIPEGRARYLDRVGQLYTNVFNTELILKRIDELQARLDPVLAEMKLSPWEKGGNRQAVQSLKTRIARRGRSIGEQLTERTEPLQFTGSGEAKLTGWAPRRDLGNASYSAPTTAEGTRLLKIHLQNGSGSWRTRVLLEPGEYRFTGSAKINGFSPIPGNERSGVGLRLSGGAIRGHLVRDTDWTIVSYDFDVQGIADVELICEANGQRGEAMFEADSLKLVRR